MVWRNEIGVVGAEGARAVDWRQGPGGAEAAKLDRRRAARGVADRLVGRDRVADLGQFVERLLKIDRSGLAKFGGAQNRGRRGLVETIALNAQIGRASCRERVCQYV